MRVTRGIRDNLRFLIAEVSSQVDNLADYMDSGSTKAAMRILDRTGYAQNLKMRIHASCVDSLACGKDGEATTLALRAVELIATELDGITAHCRECVRHMMTLERRRHVRPKVFVPFLKKIRRGVDMVESVVRDNDSKLALKLGSVEGKLDRRYRALMKRYIAELKRKRYTEDLIAGLFIARTIEQMGNALRIISESVISANLGQPMNRQRYQSIQASVAALEAGEESMDSLQVAPIAETRSGSAISGIALPERGRKAKRGTKSEDYLAIYKDGLKRKLKEERQGVESWHEIYPGLAPKILDYQKRGDSASLLIEHLAGQTFEQILLHESADKLNEALKRLVKTLRSVWQETRTKKPVNARFMQQTRKRIDQVYSVHREFAVSDSKVCDLSVPSFDDLLKQAETYEERIEAPFSVYIHGDFNVDNIIYDAVEKRINFIDLHRSRYMDYVQDVSVFMVSNYRLQVLDKPTRQRIMQLALAFYSEARKFAKQKNDRTFELRLALGLARSFATSTRFILDKSLSRRMFLRARFLIERVLACDPKSAADFRLPIKEVFVE